MCISLYNGGDSMTRPPVEVLAEQEEKIEELKESNRSLHLKIQHLEIAHREKIEKLETTTDILTNLCETVSVRLTTLDTQIDDQIKWRKNCVSEQRVNDLERELKEQWIKAMKKIEDDTLTPEWGGCVYAKIGEIEEKLLTPLSKTPPSQDCATYYESLENQVKSLIADQESLNTNTNKTLETSLLPQDMLKRLQEMEKKIFTYKELQARGIELKKEEENEGNPMI